MSPTSDIDWASLLASLGEDVRARLIATRDAAGHGAMAQPAAQEGGDTIFAIDRAVEPVIEQAIARWPEACRPLLLVAEGLGVDGRRRFDDGDPTAPLRYRLLCDPIDGTRNIMYDKRSAWFLAAVAPERGEATSLSDAIASILLELPPSKQTLADTFIACGGHAPLVAHRVDLRTGARVPLAVRPSRATELRNGFAQVSNFFPGTKQLAAALMERIAQRTLGEVRPGEASVFDDQYITTGGQMVELMLGRDRFCCDLRPLLYRIVSQQTGKAVRGVECHPYDVAGAPVARRAGVVLTDGFGRALDARFDVHAPVHWCGYANESLRAAIEPVIVEWLGEHGVTA